MTTELMTEAGVKRTALSVADVTQYRKIYLAAEGNMNVPGTARQGRCAVREDCVT